MSKRLQVVMDDEEYDEIQEAADAGRLTVSAWVRQTLRVARVAPSDTGTGGLDPAPFNRRRDTAAEPDDELVQAVMARYGLATPSEAVAFALRRAAEPPLSSSDLLELRGAGWDGRLDALRGTDRTDP